MDKDSQSTGKSDWLQRLEAIKYAQLDGDVKYLLLMLFDYYPHIWPKQQFLAIEMGLSRSTIQRHVEKAVALGVLRVDKSDKIGHCDKYTIRFDVLKSLPRTPRGGESAVIQNDARPVIQNDARSGVKLNHDVIQNDASAVIQNDPLSHQLKSHQSKSKRTPPASGAHDPPAPGTCAERVLGVPLPGVLDNEDFRAAWELWERHLFEKHKSLTTTMAATQLAFLAKNPGAAVAIIEQSISRGWLALFELKTDSNPKRTSSRAGQYDPNRPVQPFSKKG